MSSVALTDALRTEYSNLFATCEVSPARLTSIDSDVSHIAANKARYQTVGDPLSIPWYFIGVIHLMEASLSFTTHLHNGDPLSARTVHVPAGRPAKGDPPFTWEQSATDALKLRNLDRVAEWSTPGILYQMEGYNGFGYRVNHPTVLSPYLWSGSNHYTTGKYVADGKFDPDAVSAQIGGAVILRRMAESQIIQFDQQGDPLNDGSAETSIEAFEPLVTYSETDPTPAARTLQTALNSFPGVFLRVDGVPGPRTSDAFQKVTGHFLMGDPRSSAVS